jgi:hypothetical protein
LSATFDSYGGSKAVSWETFSNILEDWVAVSSVPISGRREHMEAEICGIRDSSRGQGFCFLSATIDI